MKKKPKKNATKKTKGNKKQNKGIVFSIKAFWQRQSIPLKFLSVFALSLIAFYSLYGLPAVQQYVVIPATNIQVHLSSWILNILGQDTRIDQGVIYANEVALNVKAGCDGIEPTAFFIIGVLLVPLSWRSKLVGLAVGIIVLQLLNLIRIVGLFFAKVYWPSSFDVLHLHGGFTLFFVLTIIIWMIWANWAIQTSKLSTHT